MLSRRLIALLIAALAAVTVVPVALAASKNGITPTQPKAGGSVAAGKAATFKGRLRGGGKVFIHVCKKPKRNADGLICSKETLVQAKRSKGRFNGKAKFFDFPAYWLNKPGTYYWQAHRVRCEEGLADCYQEGPVVRFRVA